MAKNVGGFAQKMKRGREKRDYSLVKYIKSIRSKKTGHWRFQEQILRVDDGESVAAALKRTDRELHPEPEEIPVIQPEVKPAPVEEAEVEEATEEVIAAEAVTDPEVKVEPKAEEEPETEAVAEEAEVIEEKN